MTKELKRHLTLQTSCLLSPAQLLDGKSLALRAKVLIQVRNLPRLSHLEAFVGTLKTTKIRASCRPALAAATLCAVIGQPIGDRSLADRLDSFDGGQKRAGVGLAGMPSLTVESETLGASSFQARI